MLVGGTKSKPRNSCPRRRPLWGYRGIRIGEAVNPGPGGARRTARVRTELERTVGYDGVRVGEAANPGPMESQQLAMIMSLLQTLIQLIGQLTAGETGNAQQSLQGAQAALTKLSAEPRRVSFQEPAAAAEEEWQEVRQKRQRKPGGERSDKPTSPTTTLRTVHLAAPQPAKGKGKGQSAGQQAGRDKGQGKGKGPGATLAQSGALRAGDWQGKLLSFDDLAAYEGAGESLIVATKDEAEASVAAGMIQGAALKSSFLVLWPDDRGKHRVPYWHGPQVTMRAVSWDTWQHGTVPVPSLKGSKAERTLKTEATAVVRVIVVQEFASQADWQAAHRGYRSFVISKLAVADAWGAAEETRHGSAIVGLARVKAANLEGLLAKSGGDGIFVEPVGRSTTGPSFAVRWVEQEAGEARLDYFRRTMSMKVKAGLVMGRRQLGVREEATPENQVRSWRLTGAPKHWSSDTVGDVLEGAGLQDATITSRMLRRGFCTWFFRAKSSEDCVHLPVKEGENTFNLYILPAQVARRALANRQPLKPERSQQMAMERFSTTLETKKDMEVGEDGKEQPGGKRRAQEVREVPSGVKLHAQLKDGNCLAHSIGAGLDWLKSDGKKRPARLIRSELYNYMKKHQGDYAAFWDARNCADQLVPGATFKEYLEEMALDGKFLNCLELEAAAAAFGLTIVVIPTDAGVPPTKHGNSERIIALWYNGAHYDLLLPEEGKLTYPASITGVLAFGAKTGGRGGGEVEVDSITIYTYVEGEGRVPRGNLVDGQGGGGSAVHADQEVDTLTVYTQATGGGARVRARRQNSCQGGAKSSRPASVHTLRDAFRAASSHGTVGQEAAGAASQVEEAAGGSGQHGAAPTITEATHLQDIDAMLEVEEQAVPPPPPPKRHNGLVRSRRGQIIRSSWPCPECGWVATGPNWRQLKTAHIKKNHTDLADRLGKAEVRCALVPWGPECCWKCPVKGCNVGLKDDGVVGQHRHMMRMRHRAEAHPDLPKAMFYLNFQAEDRAKNAAKASIACRNQGAAKRVQGLRVAEDAGHTPVWVSYPIPPPAGARKKVWHETLVHRLFCKECCNITRTAEDLAQRDCVPGYVSGTIRKMLRRLRARLEDSNVPEATRAAAQHTIETVSAGMEEAGKSAGTHRVEAVAWPGDEWTVRFLCGGCGALSEVDGHIKGECTRLGRRRPTRALKHLRDIAGEAAGVRANAAKYILERLGYPFEAKGEHKAMAALAAGLGQGP